jgi:hypothetical protein
MISGVICSVTWPATLILKFAYAPMQMAGAEAEAEAEAEEITTGAETTATTEAIAIMAVAIAPTAHTAPMAPTDTPAFMAPLLLLHHM